ncbi:MAG: alanine dehydrogenase [Flavobacteriales bacterium]|nr:alanine dehydrogenase [Flavobacteriales bacterium]
MTLRKENISFIKTSGLLPQEEMLEVGTHKKSLYIGIPKESSSQEKRVVLTPDSVGFLVNNGNRVVIETGAGNASNFSDREYSEAGGEIQIDTQEVFNADIIIKVAPPSISEIKMMHEGQTLISTLKMSRQSKEYIQLLIKKKITALAFNFIKNDEGIYPVIRTMGEIAGTTSILIAAEYLSSTNNGKGVMMGGIAGVPPIEVIILGAGTVGEFAARAAHHLGATVKVFDNYIYKLRRLQVDLGTKIYTSTIQPKVLGDALKSADVVIGSLRAPKGLTPCVVTEHMVENMKEGSVIVDVSIDQGGCFETSELTSHDKPIITKFGVKHYCVPNIASRVSRTASYALSNIFAPILIDMCEMGGLRQMVRNDMGFRNGIYLYKGILTNRDLGEMLDLPYKDTDLLMAAF